MTAGVSRSSDERGDLVAVELTELPLVARRVFVASGSDGGAVRGQHRVPCAQLMILISGHAEVELGASDDDLDAPVVLDRPGSTVELAEGQYVRYRLRGPHSHVLVIADQPYRLAAP